MVDGKKKANSVKIGIDCRLWDESGVGRYTRNLVSELAKLDTENFYYLFLLKKNLSIKVPKNFVKVEANFGWYGFTEQLKLPKILKQYDLDLVHFPHFNVPLLYRGKFIVTIHDLLHQHFAMKRATTLNPVIYKVKRLSYQQAFRHAAFQSQKIITPSQSVKDQLIDEWKINDTKITVTPEGVEENLLALKRTVKKDDFKKVAEKFNIKGQYLFYIGNAHPHKNVEGLLAAFKEIRERFPEVQLVLSGPDHYFWQRVQKENQSEGVIYTGFVTDKELVTLYSNAKALVVPSFEEGFGIPLLEAMACGCPVVSSNGGSLPEVGGDACLYFDPKNKKEMVSQIEKIIKDEKLRKSLISKGEKRYKQFSWEKMAKQTLQIYKDSL